MPRTRLYAPWLSSLPQPRWLRRWYYRKSFDWWGHPSNGHWKQYTLRTVRDLRPGERDLFGGDYNGDQQEKPDA